VALKSWPGTDPDGPGLFWDDDVVDPRLGGLFGRGFPALLGCRWSGLRKRDAARRAVKTLQQAIEHLARREGIVVRGLDDPDELVDLFLTYAQVEDFPGADGKPIRNRHFVYTDLLPYGVVVLTQTGTGKALDADDQQPAVLISAATVTRYQPALTFAFQSRGWARRGFEMQPLVSALRGLRTVFGELPFFGNVKDGVSRFDRAAEKRLFESGHHDEIETEEAKARMSGGERSGTHLEMTDGQIQWALRSAVPPPLAQVRMRDPDTGGEGTMRVYYDTDGCRPDPAQVLLRQPHVYRHADTGARITYAQYQKMSPEERELAVPVDQLSLSRWFWQHYLLPDWSDTRIGRHLAQQQGSTDKLRSDHGPDAVFRVRARRSERDGKQTSDASHIIRSYFSARHFHLTGELVRSPGDGGGELVIVMPPPDGEPILTAEDDARVSHALEHKRAIRATYRAHLLAGLLVFLDGRPVRLDPAQLNGQVVYRYQDASVPATDERDVATEPDPSTPADELAPRRRRRRVPSPALPHAPFVESIVTELAASQVPLRTLLPVPGAEQARTRDLVADLDAQISARQVQLAHHFAELSRSGPDALSPSLRRKHAQAHDAVEAQIAELTRAKDNAERDAARELAKSQASGLWADELVELVTTLRDPHSTRFRAQLRLALREVHLTTHKVRTEHGLVTELRWTFTLLLRAPGVGTWALTGSGVWTPGARHATDPERVGDLVQGMRAGSPFLAQSRERRWLAEISDRMPGRGPFLAGFVQDPRLLKLWMAVGYPEPDEHGRAAGLLAGPPLTDAQLKVEARRRREPLALLRRIRDQAAETRLAIAVWLRRASPGAEAAVAAAGRTGRVTAGPSVRRLLEGQITQDGDGRWWLIPCRFCGSTQLTVSRLREVDGLVCRRRTCRRDRSGVVWPVQPYGQYDAPARRGW
jgi:hypothetical protein